MQLEHEHILVYDYGKESGKEKKEGVEEDKDGFHAVYVHKYNARKRVVTCINSHGSRDEDNPYPRVPLSEARHLFQVTCSAEQCPDQ